MSVVDLVVVSSPSASAHRDQFVVKMSFEHDDDAITEEKTAVFPAAQKADIIEFVNVLWAANDYVMEHAGVPEDDEVEGYDKWCEVYNQPGLDGWPSDSNGNYFAELSNVTVVYYDANGTRFDVTQVNDD
ncbi:hypothetical protein D3C87_1318980 [compost metagenome]